jgi:hypothetical protein
MLTEEEKAKKKEEYRERMKRRGKIIWFVFGGFFFFLIFGRVLWGPIGVNILYSEGERKVQIVKIASRGLIWKTWEIQGIMAPGHGIATTYVWSFSIDNADPRKNELLQKINNAYDAGRTVNIRYEQKAGSVPWRSKTTYFAKEIDVI